MLFNIPPTLVTVVKTLIKEIDTKEKTHPDYMPAISELASCKNFIDPLVKEGKLQLDSHSLELRMILEKPLILDAAKRDMRTATFLPTLTLDTTETAIKHRLKEYEKNLRK